MGGVEGKYIRIADRGNAEQGYAQRLEIERTLDPSLRDLAERILPLAQQCVLHRARFCLLVVLSPPPPSFSPLPRCPLVVFRAVPSWLVLGEVRRSLTGLWGFCGGSSRVLLGVGTGGRGAATALLGTFGPDFHHFDCL